MHALVGENGAGKSTLIKTITGAYTPDTGTIKIGEVEYDSLTPQQARRLGVGVVYQEFNLLPDMPVAENIFLATPPMARFGLFALLPVTALTRIFFRGARARAVFAGKPQADAAV